MEKYVKVTSQNTREIMEELKRKRGRLLISEPGYQSFPQGHIIDAHIGLWDSPIIDSRTSFHVQRGSVKKNGEDWQTNWERDRNYLLRPVLNPTGDQTWDFCRELFDKLIIDSYEFEIGFQSVVGREIFADNGITLYIPKSASIESAFKKGISYIVRQINKTIEKEKLQQRTFSKMDEERITQYAMKDYVSGKIFQHNVRAGLEVDALLF